MSTITEIYNTTDLARAYAVVALLHEQGITTELTGESLNNAVGGVPAYGGVTVWVAPEQWEAALLLLQEHGYLPSDSENVDNEAWGGPFSCLRHYPLWRQLLIIVGVIFLLLLFLIAYIFFTQSIHA